MLASTSEATASASKSCKLVEFCSDLIWIIYKAFWTYCAWAVKEKWKNHLDVLYRILALRVQFQLPQGSFIEQRGIEALI